MFCICFENRGMIFLPSKTFTLFLYMNRAYKSIRDQSSWSLRIILNFTSARTSGNILLTYLEAFYSSDTHQSMKTSDSDLKVNQNIYPDAVNLYFG